MLVLLWGSSRAGPSLRQPTATMAHNKAGVPQDGCVLSTRVRLILPVWYRKKTNSHVAPSSAGAVRAPAVNHNRSTTFANRSRPAIFIRRLPRLERRSLRYGYRRRAASALQLTQSLCADCGGLVPRSSSCKTSLTGEKSQFMSRGLLPTDMAIFMSRLLMITRRLTLFEQFVNPSHTKKRGVSV